VLISDFNKAFKRATRAIFSDSVKYQLCQWYIMKNVIFNIKKKWIGSLDGIIIGELGSTPGTGDPGLDEEAAPLEAPSTT
jgi:hypothetical protein